MRRTLVAAAVLGIVAGSAPVVAQPANEIRLPTPQDALAIVPGAEDILLGAGFEERQFPGRVSDRERVEVRLGTSGQVEGVRVTQRLTLEGLGDFSFRIPGPVRALEPLEESQSRPGLRRGSVIWQGFVPNRRVLGARMELYPEIEAPRLPLRVSLSIAVAGTPIDGRTPATGPLDLRLSVENATAIDTRVSSGSADPAEVAEALDAIRASLDERRRPVPGRAGVPRIVPVEGDVTTRIVSVQAPIGVRAEIRFPPGSVSGLRVRGARRDGGSVAFARLLGGGLPGRHEIRIAGRATGLELPDVVVTARPAPPAPSTVAPPDGAPTWAAAAAGQASDGRAMLDLAMETMWRVARLRVFDAYLGTPDPRGPARSTYVYSLDPALPPAPAGTVTPPPGLGTFGMALAAVAALALLFAAGLLWAHG